MPRRSQLAAIASGIVAGVSLLGAADPPAPRIPLCPGLTVVTAVNQADGDYESIKTIESVTDSAVRMKYSSERTVEDMLLGPKFQKLSLYRTVRRTDLQSATLYEQQFSSELPETIPETTAIGASSAVLNALKTKGEATLGIFIAYSQDKPPIDRNVHPNVYDNQMVTTVKRVGSSPVLLPVIVNDVPVTLPTIQAAGDFFGDKAEFFFLDDADNPLAVKFRVGIGAIKPLTPDMLKQCERAKAMKVPASQLMGMNCDKPNGGDRDVLRVIKITSRCGGPADAAGPSAGTGRGQVPGGGAGVGGGASAGANALEQALANTGKVDVYSIYFSFNSDVIREESEPTLKDIAEVLRRHPEWRLAVNGHTDGIGGDQSNLNLSKRRAAAVADALVKRYGIAAGRLTEAGFGKSQPKDTNDTIEGRARNRRVELAKIG